MVGSIEVEGILKLLNPEARVTTPPLKLTMTTALGIVAINHHFESRGCVPGSGVSRALQEA
jgi:hypothetical protein